MITHVTMTKVNAVHVPGNCVNIPLLLLHVISHYESIKYTASTWSQDIKQSLLLCNIVRNFSSKVLSNKLCINYMKNVCTAILKIYMQQSSSTLYCHRYCVLLSRVL